MDAVLRFAFGTVAAIAVGIVGAVGISAIVDSIVDQDFEFLYHYTSAEGAMNIKRDRKIQRSNRGAAVRKGSLGEGVYLTSVRPTKGKKKILLNNYDGLRVSSGRADSADFFFRFRKDDLPGKKLKQTMKRDIWHFPLSIDLTEIDYAFGETGAGSAVLFHHRTDDATLLRGDQV